MRKALTLLPPPLFSPPNKDHSPQTHPCPSVVHSGCTVPPIFCCFDTDLHSRMTFKSTSQLFLLIYLNSNPVTKNCLFANATHWDPRWHSPLHHISADPSTSFSINFQKIEGSIECPWLSQPLVLPDLYSLPSSTPYSEPIWFSYRTYS